MNNPIKSDAMTGEQELWPEGLDALIASPENHTLMFENDKVRVLDTHIPPGETTKIHTHRWPGVLYILSWSQIVRYDDKGNVIYDSRKDASVPDPSTARWSPQLPPHRLENVGTTHFHLINVELKQS